MNEGGTKNEACYAPGSGFVDWRKNEVVYDAVCVRRELFENFETFVTIRPFRVTKCNTRNESNIQVKRNVTMT